MPILKLSKRNLLLVQRLGGWLIVATLCGVGPASDPAYGQATIQLRLEQTEPAAVGLDKVRMAAMDALIAEAIVAEKLPGCVVCVGRQGKIAWLKAYGNKRLEPTLEAMTTDTVFDLASLTKPIATATSIMKLMELGQLRLDQKVVDWLPEFGLHGKEEIRLTHLLVHQSGLIPDNALADYEHGPEVAWQRICELKLVAAVGAEFKYSDVNFIVLAKLVEKISGRHVHAFSHDEIFAPLGMSETGFVPAEALRKRAAPTEQRAGKWMQGEVHDPRAYLLNGIAGHAGLFSTAEDLAVYSQMLLNDGKRPLIAGLPEGNSTHILAPATVQAMTAPIPVSSGIRGLGWDKQTGYSSNKGDRLSDRAFGHGGFTGTVLWIDPELDLFVIFLSNRLHPKGKGQVNALAGEIINVVVSANEGS